MNDSQKQETHWDMCSISRSIDKIGDSWSLLILRDLGTGISHFDELRKNLEIAPGVLSKRLSTLVEEGLVKKELYQDNPPRAEYVLTKMGEDFLPVLALIMAWGNKHASPKGIDTELVDKETHKKVDPIVVDQNTGQPIEFVKLVFAGGPANSATKIEFLKKRHMPLTAAH